MGRSIWKGIFLEKCFIKKISYKQKISFVWSRQTAIPHYLVGVTVSIHNGKLFRKLVITREKVGFKFGAFITTRTKPKIQLKSKKVLTKKNNKK